MAFHGEMGTAERAEGSAKDPRRFTQAANRFAASPLIARGAALRIAGAMRTLRRPAGRRLGQIQ